MPHNHSAFTVMWIIEISRP